MYKVRNFVKQTASKAIIAVSDISKSKLSYKANLRIPHVGTSVKIVSETENMINIAKFKPDGSYDDGDFRILCTTDLHLDSDLELNRRTLQDLVDRIAELKPDLVVFTGDCILSKFQQTDTIQFARMMEKVGVYWAYVFGNHEAREEKGSFKHLLYKSMIDSPYCLSRYGDDSLFGYGNFIINIMNSENSVRKSLVFLDSGRSIRDENRERDGVPANINGYDYVKPSQIEWYKNEMNSLKNRFGDVKSMVYLHIPVPEYKGFFEKNGDGSFVPKETTELIYGTMRENVGCSEFNSGLFDAMKEIGGQAIFCGHDHCNDYCVKKDGIYLVYNQTGGYNCYRLYEQDKMSPDESTWHFGVNRTDISKDGKLSFGHCSHADCMKK